MSANGPERGVVLWTRVPMVCTLVTHTRMDRRFEIRLFMERVLVSSEFFKNSDDASHCAIKKMRAYRAS
jgi:hypothetical protein